LGGALACCTTGRQRACISSSGNLCRPQPRQAESRPARPARTAASPGPSTRTGAPAASRNWLPSANASPSECAGSVETTSTRSPASASRTASAAEVDVFPTPPLPPTKTNRGPFALSPGPGSKSSLRALARRRAKWRRGAAAASSWARPAGIEVGPPRARAGRRRSKPAVEKATDAATIPAHMINRWSKCPGAMTR
jgi:hypothetical protein